MVRACHKGDIMITDFSKVIIRRLRLVRINRNLLVFLVFLLISIIFWFMQTIKETTEVSLVYKLNVVNMPKNAIFTTDLPEEVNIIYSSKGWNAFYYKFMKSHDQALTINFKDIDNNAGKVIIDVSNIRKAANKHTPEGMSFKSAMPNKIEAYYSNGQHKRVPVIFNGHVSTNSGRYLCGIHLQPDSVDVYAPEQLFNSINDIKTESAHFTNVEDTIRTELSLIVPKGIKVLPDKTDAEICVDIFTDKTIEVPIYSENVPSNTVLRTFPLRAKVTFLVSSTLYNDITADNFLIVVDYNDTKKGQRRCKIYVRQQPYSIRHLRIAPESVEYVIEQETE